MTGIAQIAELQFPSLERIFFNAAGWHPLPRVAIEALTRYAASRGHPDHGQDNTAFILNSVRTNVARLIGASASDIALVPSTTVAEQLFVRAAGLPSSGALVTDLMHFDASIYAYDAMARAGADVRLVEPRDGRIDLADIEAQLARGGVRLVAVSAVSNMTGFAHDLPALSNLVHRHGALLYADIIQLAGAAPFDMAGSGVDACAGSGFKWLMGDIGLGFLSVRPELRSALLRPIHGYRQLVEDIEPWPPTGTRDWVVANDAAGLFEAASLPVGVASSLAASTGLLHEIGIDKIVAHRGPLLARIAAALPPLGYRRITPEGSIAPFLVFDKSSRPGTSDLLQAAGIDVGLMGDVMRISVSIFNTEDHVDRLIAALSG